MVLVTAFLRAQSYDRILQPIQDVRMGRKFVIQNGFVPTTAQVITGLPMSMLQGKMQK